MKLEQLLFVGLNARVVALDRDSGEIVWQWQSPKPKSGYVILVVEKNRIFVSVSGYLYCLEAATGEQLWYNPLKGFGSGIACLASVNSPASPALQAQIAQQVAALAAAAAASS